MIKKRQGSALVLIIIIFAVLAVFGTSILNISVSENKQVAIQEDSIKSYYAARSGIEAMASYLIQHPEKAMDTIQKTDVSPATGTIDGRTFNIVVAGLSDPLTGKVRAPIITSTVNGITGGVGIKHIKLQLLEHDFFSKTVFTDHSLNIGNNMGIIGDVGTNANTINFGHYPVDGNVTLGVNASSADIGAAQSNITFGHTADRLTPPIQLRDIQISKFQTIWAGGTNLSNSGINYFQVADFGGNSDYILSGDGELHILVTNSFIFTGNASVLKPSPSDNVRLYLYYPKSDTVTFNGNANYFCGLYAPEATVNFNGGGSGTFTGSIVCDDFIGPSSNTNFNEDPGLNMDHLMIDGVAGYDRGAYSK